MPVIIITDYQDTRSGRTLQVAEYDGTPRETALRIAGPRGGIHAIVTLDRRAAAHLGAELVRLYGTEEARS